MKEITVSLQDRSYPIYIGKGCTEHLELYMDTSKRTLLVSDSNIPEKWLERISAPFEDITSFRFPAGEENKNIETWQSILEAAASARLGRKDQIIALGGGVTGDMAGFAAACYMRGIDFYNIPTTVLSQVDSSVGGKTAVDLAGMKNIIGAFWQPKAVFIDEDLLSTLDGRQMSNGLAEALKMGILFDQSLLNEFEREDMNLENIIARSIDLKRLVVEQDEKESSLRRVLNFGHTLGHAIEGSFENFEYLHGECVAAGMLYFIQDEALYKRVLEIEKKLNLPEIRTLNSEKAKALLRHDKKGEGKGVSCVFALGLEQPEIRFVEYSLLDGLLGKDPYEKYLWD